MLNDFKPDDTKMIISYDGSVVRQGRMSAVDAGTAIVGMANMVAAASQNLFGDGSRVTSQVETNFVKGSFEINFIVEQASGLFMNDASLKELMVLLFGPGHTGLLGLIRRLGGKKAEAVGPIHKNGDDIVLKIKGDNNNITVNSNTYNLYNDTRARESAESITRPLERDGMDTLTIGSFSGVELPSVRITSDEAPYYRAPSPEEKGVHKSTSEVYLRVVSPNFQPGGKWRFARGESVFFASVEDDGFLERVKKYEERFGDGDTIIADMKTETIEVEGRMKVVHTIVKVKDHQPPRHVRQMTLDEQVASRKHAEDEQALDDESSED